MEEQLLKKGQLPVFFAIIKSNIILNARRYLIQRQVFLTIIFVVLMFFIMSRNPDEIPDDIISWYIVFILMFITRSQIIEYADHKNKYFNHQKAYGISGYTYLAAWGIYSILSGLIKALIVIILTYSFFSQNHSLGAYYVSVSQICIAIMVAYFTFYSYSFFFNAILPHNFIGIRLICPLFLCVLAQQLQPLLNFESPLTIQLNPARWVIEIVYYKYFQDLKNQTGIYYISPISFLVKIAVAQFFIPIVVGIVVEVIKFQRFYIKTWFFRVIKKKNRQIIQVFLQPQIQNNINETFKLISLNGVEKSFNKHKVLNNISLDIFSSEIIVLSGKNSSGKSTLLQIMAQIATITSGTMLKKEGITISVCFQQSHSYQEFTVKENLSFYGIVKGIIQLQSRIDYLLESFELNEIANKKVQRLSGGNKKKLSLALAFLGKNDLILIDEPTLGVDVVIKEEIWRILRKQKAENNMTSFIIASSDPELQLIEMSSRVLTLLNGQLIVNCTLAQLQKSSSFIIVELKNSIGYNQSNMQLFNKLQQQNKIKKIPKRNGQLVFQMKPTYMKQFKKVLIKLSLLESIRRIRISNLKDKLQKSGICQTQQEAISQEMISKYIAIISQINPSKSLFRTLYACFLIRITQNVPNFAEAFALIFLIPVTCIFFTYSFLLEKRKLTQQISTAYPNYCYIIFPQIYYTHVRSRERKEEEMMFVHGLKKGSYWFVSIALDSILLAGQYILILALCYTYHGFPQQISKENNIKTIVGMLCYLVSTTIIVKIYSLLFKRSIFAFTFLPFILLTLDKFVYLVESFPDYSKISLFMQMFSAEIQYLYLVSEEIYQPYLQIFLYFLAQVTIHSTILILIPTLSFDHRSKQKNLNSKYIHAINSIDKINEKLRVTDWEQSNTEKDEITIENLYLQYSKTTVIKEMYLGVAKGTIFGLLGRNGSGKTTTLRLVCSLISRTSGYVYFGNKTIDSASSPIYEVMGYCPQFDYYHPEITVVRHLTIVLILKGVPLQYHKELCEVMLQVFDMLSALKKKTKLLSEGEKCKLKIITALLCNPKGKYMLLDEPTVGLDQASQQTFAALLLRAAKELQMTFLYITHRISEAEKLCDRVGILQRGEFININSPKQLVSEFSRGHTITIKAKDINKLREQLQPKVQSLFQINEWRQDEKQGTIEVCIPRLCFSMDKALAVLKQLQLDPDCVFYCLKEDDFEEVFDYLATRNRQENDLRQRETEMIDITI